MARKANPWIPSGGVLVVAVIAAVVAAVLLNVYISLVKARHSAIICHPQKDHSAIGIGKRRHFGCKRVSILHVHLELPGAVLAESNLRLQFLDSHFTFPHSLIIKWSWLCIKSGIIPSSIELQTCCLLSHPA